MKLKFAKCNDIFLNMTRVENLFINEFLPNAPGEYVKVYLLGLMYAQYEEEIDTLVMAKALGMEQHDVEEAWDYWDAIGLVVKSKDGSSIEFIRLVEKYYGEHMASSAMAQPQEDEEIMVSRHTAEYDRTLTSEQIRMIFARLQELSGRTISRAETDKLTDALRLYDIKPEVLYYAIDYCAGIDNYNVDYITKVALRWKETGCDDRESVRELLEKNSERNLAYREIFKAVGFNRTTTPADREIMDRWFDEMGCSLDEILEACKSTGGIREPSLRYVNKVLENKREVKDSPSGAGDAKVSRKLLRDYYEHIREEEEKAHAARIREAASNIPALMEILEREKALNTETLSLLGQGTRVRREEIREERKKLEESKAALLSTANYPADFLDKRYRCNICKDTGYTDEGTVCVCARARADEAYMWNSEKDKN